MLTWSVLIFCFISLVVAPRLLLDVARVVAIYMMVRLIALTVFYLAGLARFRKTERQAGARRHEGLSGRPLVRHEAVHHLVILPNFDEPQAILSRTLQSLCVQQGARDCMTVVLGMEEREQGARDKAETLLAQYRGRFYGLIATYHPSNLPGEVPGKGMNEAWAARCARRELVERLGIPPSQIAVTVADSDSIFHPLYFAELTRQFAADPRRHALIWQAPMLFDNDIWQTHPIIRLVTYYSNVVATGDYINSWEPKFPYSTYSISLELLEEVDYWDPTVIAEDVNIFMRSFFKKGGQAFVQRIYLPTHGNPTHGANLWQAMGIFYAQKVRHGWGGVEIGYLLQKWNCPPGTPFVPKLWRLLKLIHDHLFFSTAGIIVALGIAVSLALDRTAVITAAPVGVGPLPFLILNLLGGCALLVIWLSERVRLSRGRMNWSLKALLSEAIAWLFFPLLFFLLLNLPVLQAQTRMLLGQPFYFKRTPKGLHAMIHD
jgi:cellulose synthase/poly-beta-1,6-N-acetylglucosamine synthase-like glycosyltransferase